MEAGTWTRLWERVLLLLLLEDDDVADKGARASGGLVGGDILRSGY